MLYSVIEQNIKDSLLQKIKLLIYHRFQDKISDLNIIGLPVLYISKPIIPIVNFFSNTQIVVTGHWFTIIRCYQVFPVLKWFCMFLVIMYRNSMFLKRKRMYSHWMLFWRNIPSTIFTLLMEIKTSFNMGSTFT